MNADSKVSVSSRAQLSPGLRLALYGGLNVAVIVILAVGVAVNTPSNPRALFVILMTALCFSPVLWLRRINDRYFLLAIYTLINYQFFAFGDLMSIVVGRTIDTDEGLLSGSELLILISVLLPVTAYNLAVRWMRPKTSYAGASDWPFATVIIVGLIFWLAGTLSLTYWQVYVITDRSNVSLIKNINALGPGLTTIFMTGQLIQPLGVMILAYAYAVYRKGFLLPMIIAVVLAQVVLGFVADYKSEAMLAGLLVIVTKTYVDGKVPKAWLIGGALFIVVAFPVFQAYRSEVRGEQGVTSADTVKNVLGILQKAIDAQAKVKAGFGGAEYRVESFWERASLKSSVDLLVDHVGKTVPYQMGATLTPIATAFIPRILYPSKESIAVGQVFNRTFHLSSVEDTYLSPSHIGEVYWNFGWAGTLLIMPAIGFLLGFIGARCTAYPALSLTRLLIMLITIFAFVIRSEGSIATEIIVWMRSLAAIGILHLMFARRSSGINHVEGNTSLRAQDALMRDSPFPNLLR